MTLLTSATLTTPSATATPPAGRGTGRWISSTTSSTPTLGSCVPGSGYARRAGYRTGRRRGEWRDLGQLVPATGALKASAPVPPDRSRKTW